MLPITSLSPYPFTVITCPALTPPDNGNVNQLGNTPGGLALYTCNDNFEPSDETFRECGPDGQWTGEAPLCVEGKQVLVQWHIYACMSIVIVFNV